MKRKDMIALVSSMLRSCELATNFDSFPSFTSSGNRADNTVKNKSKSINIIDDGPHH